MSGSVTSTARTTVLLRNAAGGSRGAADALLPLVYDELRSLAAAHMRHERAGHTLQPTALAHEVYLRLIDQSEVDWQGRAHFMGVAAQMIRRILVDHARRKNAEKHGGGRITLLHPDHADDHKDSMTLDLLALEEALDKLKRLSEREMRVVELRFFGGLSVEESAHVLEVSARTVKGDWAHARAWLRRELEPEPER